MRESFKALSRTLEKVSDVYDRLGSENLWWRGQPQRGLKLIPRIYREPNDGTNEFDLTLNFDRQAPLRYSSWPKERSHRLILMQHFGLPTRLLDWSLGVFTALYFAVCDNNQNDKPAALWALHPLKLNKQMLNDPVAGVLSHEEPKINQLVDIVFQRNSERLPLQDQILAMTGPELDLRMLVQWGVFTIHATDRPIEKIPDYKDFAEEIIIQKEDRLQLQHALLISGFSHSRLFPDLQSLAEEIRQRYKY